jgi:hypothetical protein
MKSAAICFAACLWLTQVWAAPANVLVWSVDKDMETTYQTVYKSLENNKYFVVFEPNIQANLSRFAERWGDEYNRNKLEGIRAMVFCNGWYANQVSNADPEMLALCPLHITLIQQRGATRVLFTRPSVVASGTKAQNIAKELEEDVSKAIEAAVKELNGCPATC